MGADVVVVPRDQGCCGALHVHAGLRNQGREQAKINIQAVEGEPFDAIITNAAGCGSTLKEYGDLFEHDSEWRERAERLVRKAEEIAARREVLKHGPELGAKVVDTAGAYGESEVVIGNLLKELGKHSYSEIGVSVVISIDPFPLRAGSAFTRCASSPFAPAPRGNGERFGARRRAHPRRASRRDRKAR